MRRGASCGFDRSGGGQHRQPRRLAGHRDRPDLPGPAPLPHRAAPEAMTEGFRLPSCRTPYRAKPCPRADSRRQALHTGSSRHRPAGGPGALEPAERLAFVLHGVCSPCPSAPIAPVVEHLPGNATPRHLRQPGLRAGCGRRPPRPNRTSGGSAGWSECSWPRAAFQVVSRPWCPIPPPGRGAARPTPVRWPRAWRRPRVVRGARTVATGAFHFRRLALASSASSLVNGAVGTRRDRASEGRPRSDHLRHRRRRSHHRPVHHLSDPERLAFGWTCPRWRRPRLEARRGRPRVRARRARILDDMREHAAGAEADRPGPVQELLLATATTSSAPVLRGPTVRPLGGLRDRR